ncbi:MAG: hypothetical protein ACR2MG_06465 [Pyrinomonadaceae bacterium]
MKKSALFAVFLLVFCVIGCKLPNLSSKTESNSNSSTNSNNLVKENVDKSSPTVTAGDNPREDIINATKKFSEVDSFAANLTGNASNQNFNMDMQYTAPDRYYIKNDISEIIIIGNDSYVNVEGNWKKVPMQMGDKIKELRNSFTEEGMKSLKDVEYIGKENLDGKEALAYRYKTETKDVPSVNSKIWIGADNGLPLKIEIEKTGKGSALMTTSYDYDKEIKIEAPTVK